MNTWFKPNDVVALKNGCLVQVTTISKSVKPCTGCVFVSSKMASKLFPVLHTCRERRNKYLPNNLQNKPCRTIIPYGCVFKLICEEGGI